MGQQENSGFPVDDSTKYTDKKSNAENEKENNEDKNLSRDTEKEKGNKSNSDKKENDTPEKKKRKHKKYKTSINHSALKELEERLQIVFLTLLKPLF